MAAFVQHTKYLNILDDKLLDQSHKYDRCFGFALNILHKSFSKHPLKPFSLDNLAIEAARTNISSRNLIIEFLNSVSTIDIAEEQADDIIKEWIFDAAQRIMKTMSTNEGILYLDTLKTALTYSGDSTIISDFKDDFETKIVKHLNELNPVKEFPLGVPKIDQGLRGGLGRGQMGLLQGGTGMGKTWYLLHIALTNAMKGHNTVFVSLEMNERDILSRLAAMLLKKPIEYLETHKSNTIVNIRKILPKIKGNLTFLKASSNSLTINELEKQLVKIQLDYKRKHDLVVVDYADIMKMVGRDQDYRLVHLLYTQLAGLALSNNIGVWTAGQLNKAAQTQTRSGLHNTARSYDKLGPVSIVINIDPGDNGTIVMGVQKARFNEKGFSTTLLPNWSVGDVLGLSNDLYVTRS